MKPFLVRCFLVSMATVIIMAVVTIPHKLAFKKQSSKELNVFVWGAFLSPDTIASFEKKYDTKVNLHLCSGNEEMLTKVRNGSKSDFDIIFASDYAVKILRSEQAVKEINKSKLDFMHRISPMLLDHPFDPENKYCIPYSWEVFGLAENTNLITPSDTPSLDYIFKQIDSKSTIAMIPDPVEAFSIAAYYLHKKTNDLTDKQIQETVDLMHKQKEWVEAYADYRAKYLVATENCPVGLVKSSFLPDLAAESPEVVYRLPKEGTFTSIEHVVIPAGVQNEQGTYDFMNHIFSKEQFHETYHFCAMFPACLDAIEGSILDTQEMRALIDEIITRDDMVLYDYLTEPAKEREMWISIKS